ncbi:hypothetical protein [Lactiplantibacillus pentosus]|uniref:hypothetical protein n=1 Tax=Lactiplantibacillus pentosus TaxID=1589 RepID=UPI0021A75BB4|nr:hypothetical protein [Lactiplantibacillus pentosus]MCT3064329.1 hypothetical protein [Lactiplantibacillus pentosus]
MKITLERLRYRGSFNKQKATELDNGNFVYDNEKVFDFYFGYYKQSLSQSVSSNAFNYLKDKVTIVVRHSEHFVIATNDTSFTITLPKPNDKTYNIASINPDYEVNGYDVLVLSTVGETTSPSGLG